MDFECLNLNDLIKLICFYELVSFLFVRSSQALFAVLYKHSAFRKFMKIK